VERFLHEPTRVVVVSTEGDQTARELAEAALRRYHPWKIVQQLARPRDDALIETLHFTTDHQAAAFVCTGQHCRRATDVGSLNEALQ
jgi:uncharacterized protein YyaL (SSP411 family)